MPFDVDVHPSLGIAITGSFQGTADFDPGPGLSEVTAPPGGARFLTFLDPEGGLRSVMTGAHLGGPIAFHGPSSLYMTGGFQGTVDFDPGPGVDERTAVGDSDGYLWHLMALPALPEASGAPAP
jgi:hypothetical protein